MADPDPTPDPKPDPTPKPDPPKPDPPDPTLGPDGKPWDPERAGRTIAELRQAEKDGKAAQKKAAELEARLEALEDEKLSAQDKVAKERDTLKAQAEQWQTERRTLNLKLAVHSLAPELGVADADLALAALDRTKIDYGDDGEPTNVKETLADLLERKPILKGTPAKATAPQIDANGGSQGGTPPNLTADELAAAQAMGMTAERYAAFKGKRSVTEMAALAKNDT